MIEENINYSEDITSPRQSDDVNGDNSEFSLRNRKGKIITCAKETIENGMNFFCSHPFSLFWYKTRIYTDLYIDIRIY